MAASAWQPQQAALVEIARCLKDSLSAIDRNTRRNAEMTLQTAKRAAPDLPNYLVFLLCNQTSAEALGMTADDFHSTRSAAAVMLKNDIKASYESIPDASKQYIHSVVLLGLQDTNGQIRALTGNVITELVRCAGVLAWPGVLQELLAMAANADGRYPEQAQPGAMSALLKVCEDNKDGLDQEYQSQRPLDYLIPKLLECTAISNSKARADAIACINVFIPPKPAALLAHLDAFLNRLFELATDQSDDVKKQVCRAIVQISEVAPAKIIPHMPGLVDYMITLQRNETDPELALDAAEFWLSLGEDSNLCGELGPYLSKIVPTLLECMVYDEDDVVRLEEEAEDDADEEDREQDIRPQFASNKGSRFGNRNTNGQDGANESGDLSDGEVEEYGDDDYDDDDEYGDDDPEGQWNLRKCSAAALDVLAGIFHEAVFESTLPYLKTNLQHERWPNREAAVLAIGAVADGCMDVVQPHLPELIPFLISLLSDKMPVVRQITCWALGRYSGWAAHLDEKGKAEYFLPVVDGILQRMLDKNKRVQEAAASAFASLEVKADTELGNPMYCEVIARQFAACFAQYKDRNMFILYDCVQTLAEHVGSSLQNPELVHSLMPALIGRWEKVPDESQEMFPLLECLSYVATALGNTFEPYAAPLYARSIRLISNNLNAARAAEENPALDEPDNDFLVTSLDLISSIFQALEPSRSIALVQNTSPPNLFELLLLCLEDDAAEVRQSGYALLGDCAINVFPELQRWLPQIIPLALTQLDFSRRDTSTANGRSSHIDTSSYAVTNNACWSIGEIAVQHGAALAPYAEQILSLLGTILTTTASSISLSNNTTSHTGTSTPNAPTNGTSTPNSTAHIEPQPRSNANTHGMANVPSSVHENAAIALGRLGLGCASTLSPHLSQLAPVILRVMATVSWTEEKATAMTGFANAIALNPGAMEPCFVEYLIEVAKAPLDATTVTGNGGRGPEGPMDMFKKATMQNIALYRNAMPNFALFLNHLPPTEAQALRLKYGA